MGVGEMYPKITRGGGGRKKCHVLFDWPLLYLCTVTLCNVKIIIIIIIIASVIKYNQIDDKVCLIYVRYLLLVVL
jgi:hypothetical protein